MSKEDFIKIIQRYIDKGDRCMNECTDDDNPGTYAFWDGFHNCALNILRELREDKKES